MTLHEQLSLLKRCRTCAAEKPHESFYKDKKAKDRCSSSCKQCVRARTKARAEADPERRKQEAKAWRENNVEYMRDYLSKWHTENPTYRRDWYDDNPDYHPNWRANHPGHCCESTNFVRAGPASPPWLTKEHRDAMREVYAEAHEMRQTTGDDYHVDHKVPLCETMDDDKRLVCGLHVPANIHIVPAEYNLRKGNTLLDEWCHIKHSVVASTQARPS